MKIAVGLGNPGRKYTNTPHNAGFEAMDVIAGRMGGVKLRESAKFSSGIGSAKWGEEEILLVKPLTFMNQSGLAVSALMRYRNLTPADLIVLLDDINLECGRIRVRSAGSSGGHKGLDSVINETGSAVFPRIRIGVGPGEEVADRVQYVLAPFHPDLAGKMDAGINRAAEAFFVMIEKSVEEAMNRFNGPAVDGAGSDEKEKPV